MTGPALDLEASAAALRALAHAVRLGLLRALARGERSVGELDAALGIGQPALSQQLAILRKADLVQARREAKQVFYRLNAPHLAELGALIGTFAAEGEIERGPAAAPLPASGVAAAFARVERPTG